MRMTLPTFPAYYTTLDKLGWWALRGFGVALLAFLLLPILVIVPLSFSSSSFLAYPVPGWSLQWYHNLFTSAEWLRAAKNSFIVAPAATVIATVLGTLTAVGLADLIAPDRSAYERLAVELATAPDRLGVIRRRLADKRLTMPLFDTALSTRHIEAAWVAMMDRHRRGLAPEHLQVTG